MDDMRKLHPLIVDELEAVQAAEESLQTILKEIRLQCPHHIVVEKPWTEYGNARRICLRCRLEEEGSHWSGGRVWSCYDHKEPTLGNEEHRHVLTPKQVGLSGDTFWSLRI